MTKIKISKATIVRLSGTDTVFLEVDLPSGVWPYEGTTSVKLDVARGRAESYMDEHLPHVPYVVVVGNG